MEIGMIQSQPRAAGHGLPRVPARAPSGARRAGTRGGAPGSSRRWRCFGAVFAAAFIALATGCATIVPKRQGDLCAVFEQNPHWYDYARESTDEWGTPIHVLMAFVRHESSYRSDARPPFRWFLFVPLGRSSSARGYAQAQDPVWGEYEAERGSLFRSRSDMEDALDFIGWYNRKTRRELRISLSDARKLYLAYHEGRGGYRRGTWKSKPGVQATAKKVARTASGYRRQLARCESRFR